MCYHINMKDMKVIIAENIIQLRKQNKLTQAELAERLNYSDKAISKWERGESVPDVEILKKVAEMFGVTVDYLLTENAFESIEKFKISKQDSSNRIAIASLGVCIVWLMATIIYVYGQLNMAQSWWTVFLWAVPASAFVLLVFNRMWGKKKYEIYINTILVWSLLTAVFVQLLKYNIWLIFLIGIPVQVVIFLWSRIKIKR